jgi:hypothetical protein
MLLFWYHAWAGKWNVIPDTPCEGLGTCTSTAMKLKQMKVLMETVAITMDNMLMKAMKSMRR